jgi:hypothetical protein
VLVQPEYRDGDAAMAFAAFATPNGAAALSATISTG